MRFFVTLTILTLALCTGAFVPDFSGRSDTNTVEAATGWTFEASEDMSQSKGSRLRRQLEITPPSTLNNGSHWHVRMNSQNHERGVKVLPGQIWKKERKWPAGETYTARAKVYQSRGSSANFVVVGTFTMPDCPSGTELTDSGMCALDQPPPLSETNPDYDSRMRSVADVQAIVEGPACGGTDFVVASKTRNGSTDYVKVAIFHAGEGRSNGCRLNNYDLVENSFQCQSGSCDDNRTRAHHYRDGLVFSHY